MVNPEHTYTPIVIIKRRIEDMKKLLTVLLVCCLTLIRSAYASCPGQIHENVRETPFPQKHNTLYINPSPLLVPLEMKQSDYLQFNLSQDKRFESAGSILSEKTPWCMFNPHRILENGTWYWRVRSISRSGEAMPWSETYTFTVTEDVPEFVTPTFDVFLNNIPKEHARIYCFLRDSLDNARKAMRQHPDFEPMIAESREALAMDYRTDRNPYSKVSLMYTHTDYLNTAYTMFQRNVYAEKMVQNVRCLLTAEIDQKVIGNDFKAGELAYLLACTYETCYERFTERERIQIEEIILTVLNRYLPHIINKEEVHIFDNHFWQFTFRHLLQASIAIYDKYPQTREYLEYSYELWTARAPASGFNRDGNWHNGTAYFSANAISLFYVPTLFSYLTGTDFMQHPWYKNAGIGLAYTWQPGSLSAGFGDGHEQMNPKPLRIRSAFADLMARTTGDPYAAWYSSINDRYKDESETRLYRLASGKKRPEATGLPADAPKAVWFKDSGEMIANSNLKDGKRNLSLSFHSSPYGSGSHTHSNQNAFNLHYGGKAIYRAVGHYMNFKDAHNLLDYRNTRGQNTLLVNGIGQPFSIRAYGYITRMFNGEHISYALGDASNAYCGISEYPMWINNFKSEQLEQSVENGFGSTPLKKYRRHIFLLHPDKVVVYDELEADKAVRWDWLLHSPVKFSIDETTRTLVTRNTENNFSSVAQLFSEQACSISQTDRYNAEPNEKIAVRGEDFSRPWSLTASFAPCKKTRILTIIQVEADGKQAVEIIRTGNSFQCGDWTIEAELDAKRPTALYIRNIRNRATFSLGKKNPEMNGKIYQCRKADASVLYDRIDGEWKTQEMDDREMQITGKK